MTGSGVYTVPAPSTARGTRPVRVAGCSWPSGNAQRYRSHRLCAL